MNINGNTITVATVFDIAILSLGDTPKTIVPSPENIKVAKANTPIKDKLNNGKNPNSIPSIRTTTVESIVITTS